MILANCDSVGFVSMIHDASRQVLGAAQKYRAFDILVLLLQLMQDQRFRMILNRNRGRLSNLQKRTVEILQHLTKNYREKNGNETFL